MTEDKYFQYFWGFKMDQDITFITNEKSQSLKDRFGVLIKDTRFFDCLVGYFYTSGFHALYKSLDKTEKVRILIGISTNKQTYDLMQTAKKLEQQPLQFSSAETKQEVGSLVEQEMEVSEDNKDTAEGVSKFIEWIKSKKLEIRAYPSEKIHAKLYIMTFAEGDRDKGRVITGSSNFTQSGLIDNLEFNVELKNRADYDFAQNKFNELWQDAVDVSEKYVETIQTKTWLSNDITPYELYLKFLYEYFKDELSQTDEVFVKYLPVGFKRLEYQDQAVLNAKKILGEYGGVFISDVVGLGKTYISAMLANQLDGRNLVIAPPALIDEKNPGSWRNVFEDFQVRQTHFESLDIRKLDSLIKAGTDKYENVFIDEAHRFRTEDNATYEKLAEICRGKKVILVTATPYNNSPKDILSQIKLFQKARKSTIPGMPDLEKFFNSLDKKVKNLDRKKNYSQYIQAVKDNAREIREKVLKYLMVRRTRSEIIHYFGEDLKKQFLKFPEVERPEPCFYELDEGEDRIFLQTIELITKQFKYSRYTPLLPKYYKGELTQPTKLAQENMGKFMKILMIKRLESSFYAFRQTLKRFVRSYEQFIDELDAGNVYVSKKHTNKIFEFLENDDDEAIQRLLDTDKAQKYQSKDFNNEFREDLQGDLEILKHIHGLWDKVKRDPKLESLTKNLNSEEVLKNNKIIIFTESKETAYYLEKNLEKNFQGQIICFTGGSSHLIKEKVIDNFDAKARNQSDEYRILVTTEVLSEGVNLHRSNAVINYDIPWNPTRMMQRVGRVNRIDTKFQKIYTFNFFPTKQANDLIKLKEAAEAKINAFITLLGADAQLLTEGEPIEQHELFNKLTSRTSLTGEDGLEDSELKYLHLIKNIRDKELPLFERIKRLPKKARTAKSSESSEEYLLTYFRRGKLQKFFKSNITKESQEVDFITASKILEANEQTKKEKLPDNFFELMDKNKQAFIFSTTDEAEETNLRGGRDSATQVLRIIKATMQDRRQFTDDQDLYLKKIMIQLEEGGLPKQTSKETLKAIQSEIQHGINPLRILAVLQTKIPERLLKKHYAEDQNVSFGKREVILSEYLSK